MDIHPKISVIIPIYNGEKYLRETLDSILSQTFADFELIAVDDGSTDSSLIILGEYAELDDRVKIYRNRENMGIAYTTNFGIEQAKGEYIALTDQDDISFAKRFENQVKYLEEHPDIAVIGAQVISINSDFVQNRKSKNPQTPGAVRWGLIFGCLIANSVVMMRKDIFLKFNFRYGPAKTAQDYELFTRISPFFKLAILPDTLLYLRSHENNTSKLNFELQQQEAYDIIRMNVKNLIGDDLPDEIISGILFAKHQKKHKTIKDVGIAWRISNVLVKLMHNAMHWELTDEDRFYIKQNTASRLRRIWQDMHYHPFLWPYVLYSVILDPDVLKRKFQQLLH